MSSAHYQPYARFPRRLAWIDSTLEGGLGLLHNPIAFGAPSAFFQRPLSLQSYVPHDQVQRTQRPIQVNPDFPFLRVRELGFRLALHDVSAAAMSMLSVVMEPGEGEQDGEGEGGEWEGEYEDEDEYDGEGMGGYRENGDEGEEEGYIGEGGYGSQGERAGEHRDYHDEQGEHVGEHADEGDSNGANSEEEDEPIRGRRRKPRKPRRPYMVTCALHNTNWFQSSMEWENDHFRAVYRVSKDTFWGIVRILRRNSIFQSQGRKPQRPVYYQLGVFLMRYGIMGSPARHLKLLTSIGEGTIVLYCRRVIRAIHEHGLECVVWPTEERKVEIKKVFKKMCGLDGIIGSLDGTLCGLETKPRVSGDSYISRKKMLSINVQAMVDHNGVFITFQSGWAGSRPDVFIWPHTHVYRERARLFAPGEFLLADGGYTLSPFVLIPYARNELKVDRSRRREFSRKISGARIVVEWAFGQLKARFPALKKLGAVRDLRDIYRAVEAMMVVHHMCFTLGDIPDDLCARDSQDHDEGEDEDDLDMDDRDNGYRAMAEQDGSLLRAG